MLLTRTALAAAVALLGALGLASGCGAKSGLRDGDAGANPGDGGLDAAPDVTVACVSDFDCPASDLCQPNSCVEGYCIPAAPLLCDDLDECTSDECDPATGECVFRPLSRDEDQDGYFGPRPGFAAGEPGSCGDDCDDTSAAAHPGGQEICDGVDNDCNGIIDDNMGYEPSGEAPVRVSSQDDIQGGSGGIAFDGENYGVSFGGQRKHWQDYFKVLAFDGSTAVDTVRITQVSNDAFSGPVVWTGSVFATAWEDRRSGNSYEIFFNTLDRGGNKLGPDVRVTNAAGFSLHPEVLWNGSEFQVFWDDDRTGDKRIYAQRVSPDGALIGDNIQITSPVDNAEAPVVAEGTRRLGVVFYMTSFGGGKRVGFRTVSPDLSDASATTVVTEEGVEQSVVFSDDRFVVAWGLREAFPGDAIWGAALDESGNLLVPPRPITSGASFARSHAMLPLGDRILLIWADDRDGNYELYSKMLSLGLDQLSPRRRITFDGSDTVWPSAVFGPMGDVGVLFDDRRSGGWQPYFTRLLCTAGF